MDTSEQKSPGYEAYTPDELARIHSDAEGIRGRLALSPEYADYVKWLDGIPAYLTSLPTAPDTLKGKSE